jgi:hypothetical protein
MSEIEIICKKRYSFKSYTHDTQIRRIVTVQTVFDAYVRFQIELIFQIKINTISDDFSFADCILCYAVVECSVKTFLNGKYSQ